MRRLRPGWRSRSLQEQLHPTSDSASVQSTEELQDDFFWSRNMPPLPPPVKDDVVVQPPPPPAVPTNVPPQPPGVRLTLLRGLEPRSLVGYWGETTGDSLVRSKQREEEWRGAS